VAFEVDLLAALAVKTTGSAEGPKQKARFRASVITTFNAYLPFYEDVILRRLVSAGCQHNVLLMDANQWAAELSRPLNRPRLAGTAYTLLPIRAPGAFHPKVGLLAGEKHARVVVGSHNVTLSGFGLNRELTTTCDVTRTNEAERHLAVSAWQFIEAWIAAQEGLLPEEVLETARLVSRRFAPWLEGPNAPQGDLHIVGSMPVGPGLWERLPLAQKGRATRIVGLGAFFDRDFRFLESVRAALQPDEFIVGVEPETVSLDPEASVPRGLTFVDSSAIGRGDGYVHAKALLVEFTDGRTVLLTGSPNLSSPGWLNDASSRNAEAVVMHTGERARQTAATLGLTELLGLPALSAEAWEMLRQRLATELVSEDKVPEVRAGLAVLRDDGLAVHVSVPGKAPDRVKGFSARAEEPSFESTSLEPSDFGYFVKGEAEELRALNVIELLRGSSVVCRAAVYDRAAIGRHLRTGAQQSFRDALDGLSGDSPDIAAVVRFAEKLIFDDAQPEPESLPRASSGQAPESQGEEGGEVVVSLIVRPESGRSRRARPQLRSNDLGYVIDLLIRSLAEGLPRSEAGVGPEESSEEESIGADEEEAVDLDRAETLSTTVRTCQGKVRRLVKRLISQLERAHAGKSSAGKALQQLLAVLSVLRELRRYDQRLTAEGVPGSVVLVALRQSLITEALSLLFERHRDLYREGMEELREEEDDVSVLRGLLLWLAWDSGLDARFDDPHQLMDAGTDEWLLGRARLVALVPIVVADEVALDEARKSVLSTASPGPVQLAKAKRWLDAHVRWGRAILKSYDHVDRWPPADRGVERGMLAVARRERPERIRLVSGGGGKSVSLADFAECRSARARDFVQFSSETVVVRRPPEIA
jgi:hypothetical protein